MEFLIIIALMVGLMFFMTRGQRKKQKEAQAFRDNIQIGDEVMTQSGMLGVVVETDEKAITIESTAENYTRWVRAAVGPVPPQMVPQPEDDEFDEEEDDDVITSEDSTITAEDIDKNQN
ncbi:MAG TPA: preprotein translocase subunit YajC [Actinomycetales bacterium]|nr:preprotein translocase subunit YajC [Actinomycetales bacterium]